MWFNVQARIYISLSFLIYFLLLNESILRWLLTDENKYDRDDDSDDNRDDNKEDDNDDDSDVHQISYDFHAPSIVLSQRETLTN